MQGKAGVYLPCWDAHRPCHMTFPPTNNFPSHNITSRPSLLPSTTQSKFSFFSFLILTILSSYRSHQRRHNDDEGPDNAFASSGPLGKFSFSFLILTVLSSYRSHHHQQRTTTCHVKDDDTQRRCRTPR